MMNSSKYGLIAAAVASVLSAGAAQALNPAASAAATATFYEAGGSAQENAAFWAIEQLLQPSTIDVYANVGYSTSTGDGSYLIVSGTTNTAGNTALGFTTSQNILFFYKFNGGSFPNGAVPQLNTIGSNSASNFLNYPSISSIAAATTTGTQTAALPSNPTYVFTAVDTDTNSQAPDFGLTDVELKVFNAPANLNKYNSGVPLASIGAKQDGIYIDVFGVVVTNAVYNGTTAFPHPKTNFTKPEMYSILTGSITNWAQLLADDGTQFPSVPMWILDRGSGSGTKAAGNQYFLNYPGGTSYGASATPYGYASPTNPTARNVSSLTLTGAFQDVAESSTANIAKDLGVVQNNTTANANTASGGPVNYAIGILAAQAAPSIYPTNGVNTYSFAKIDGVGIDAGTGSDNINGTTGTTYSNVVTGKYDFAYQNSLNTRPDGSTATPLGAALATALKGVLQEEAVSGAFVGATGSFPNAVPGVLIDPTNAPAQDGGVIIWTRNKISPAPAFIDFNADKLHGGVIQYGEDPL